MPQIQENEQEMEHLMGESEDKARTIETIIQNEVANNSMVTTSRKNNVDNLLNTRRDADLSILSSLNVDYEHPIDTNDQFSRLQATNYIETQRATNEPV